MQASDQYSTQDMLAFLAPEEKQGRRKQPRPVKIYPTKRSIKRPLPQILRKAIVTIAFNSETDFDQVVHSYAKIGRLFGIQAQTVRSVVHSFVKHGKDYENICDRRRNRHSDFSIFDQNGLGQRILDKDTLQRWASKTLLERVALIKQEFGVTVTYYKLRAFYMKHGIKFRNTQMVYRSALKRRSELDKERLRFVKGILQFIIRDEPYGYLDEMSIHGFMTRNKAWSYADSPVELPVNSQGNRLKTSVYGLIGNIFNGPVLSYNFDATNAGDVYTFLQKVRRETRKVTKKKLHIILDGHPGHRESRVRDYLNRFFVPHFMPPCTPQVNSIEHFWSPFKNRMKKRLMENPLQHITQAQFEGMARQVGDSFTREDCLKFLGSNSTYMRQLLSNDLEQQVEQSTEQNLKQNPKVYNIQSDGQQK